VLNLLLECRRERELRNAAVADDVQVRVFQGSCVSVKLEQVLAKT
jgi:hypothetical protein